MNKNKRKQGEQLNKGLIGLLFLAICFVVTVFVSNIQKIDRTITFNKVQAQETLIDEEDTAKKIEEYKNCEQCQRILDEIKKREENLNEREKKVSEKEVIIEATQKKLEEEAKKVSDNLSELKEIYNNATDDAKQDMQNMIAIYSAMKPKEAAVLFNDMKMEMAIVLFSEFTPDISAPILANMEPKKANAIVEGVGVRRSKFRTK